MEDKPDLYSLRSELSWGQQSSHGNETTPGRSDAHQENHYLPSFFLSPFEYRRYYLTCFYSGGIYASVCLIPYVVPYFKYPWREKLLEHPSKLLLNTHLKMMACKIYYSIKKILVFLNTLTIVLKFWTPFKPCCGNH